MQLPSRLNRLFAGSAMLTVLGFGSPRPAQATPQDVFVPPESVTWLMPDSAASQDTLAYFETNSHHSQHTARMQTLADSWAPEKNIVFIDRDWLAVNYAFRGYHMDQAGLNLSVLDRFVRDRSGVAVDPSVLEFLAANFVNSEGYTLTDNFPTMSGSTVPMTFIIGHGHKSDAATELRDYLFAYQQVMGVVAHAPYRNELPVEVTDMHTDYHEFGHAMDDVFRQQYLDALDANETHFAKNRSETFAEVFGLLMVARETDLDDLETLVNVRKLRIAVTGPYRVSNSIAMGGDYFGAHHYNLGRASDTALSYIRENGLDHIRGLGPDELVTLAQDITQAHAADDVTQMRAMTYLFRMHYDLSEFEGRSDLSEDEQALYAEALRIRTDIENAFDHVFDLGAVGLGPDTVLGSLPFGGFEITPAVYTSGFPDDIADEIFDRAGSRSQDPVMLVQAIDERKDMLRTILEHDPGEARRARAEAELAVMDDVVLRVFRRAFPVQTAPAPIRLRPGTP